MNFAALSYTNMPPLAVSNRFFITAPAFMILAALLLLIGEDQALTSRWTPMVLALTHTIVLGFMLMIMIGCLFQVLPVTTGASLPHPRSLSIWVHGFLVTGTCTLVAGFWLTLPTLFLIAAASLFCAFIPLLLALLSRIRQMKASTTGLTITLAIFSLAITLALGFSFAGGWFNQQWFPEFRLWTNVHMLWGLIGWTLLLVMAVSFMIIPMFYVTPEYPQWLKRYMPPAIVFQLLLISITPLNPVLLDQLWLILALTTSIHPAYTLLLIQQRKRKAADMTLVFWQTAMISYLLGVAVFIFSWFSNTDETLISPLIAPTILLAGFVLTLITGMLLKIVPFLIWMKLQQTWMKQPRIPMPLSNMQQVISHQVAKRQYMLFMLMYLSMIILAAGGINPWMVKICALTILACYSHLLFHLYQAMALNQKLDHQMMVQIEQLSH